VDQAGNLYVAGWAGQANAFGPYYYTDSWLVKYDASGDQAWACEYLPDMQYPGLIQIRSVALDSSQNACLIGTGYLSDYEAAKVSPAGQVLWTYSFGFVYQGVTGIAVDATGDAYVTGGSYLTIKLSSLAGNVIWLTFQPGELANGIALDDAGDAYVTGSTTPDPVMGSSWLTIKLDNNGNRLWAKAYSGPANANNGAVAVAAAPDGSIYVTGYSANASGGTDITTIKYVQDPTIQPQPGGTVLLQLPGLPGSSAGLGATTNFIDWTELGPVVAGTNGLYQLIDTNALLFPRRFYRWH